MHSRRRLLHRALPIWKAMAKPEQHLREKNFRETETEEAPVLCPTVLPVKKFPGV